MWSTAAALDPSLPEQGAQNPVQRQPAKLPNINAHVEFDAFASINVWICIESESCTDVERQLTDLELVKKQGPHADTVERIVNASSGAKFQCVVLDRGDHGVLMCMKVRVSKGPGGLSHQEPDTCTYCTAYVQCIRPMHLQNFIPCNAHCH